MTTPIIALDVDSAEIGLQIVQRVGDRADFYKIGSSLFTRVGPGLVRQLKSSGKRVFLDLKFHDIPNTVAGAVRSAAALDVDLLTLHAAGGVAMLQAAREAAGVAGPRLLAVTVLTSFTADDVESVWGKQIRSVRDEVARLAALAQQAGVHGIVASPLEAESLKRRHGQEFLVVTPGIRPGGSDIGDQVRVATPGDAARAGADFIVIGRPVSGAPDPAAVMDAINAELAAAASMPV